MKKTKDPPVLCHMYITAVLQNFWSQYGVFHKHFVHVSYCCIYLLNMFLFKNVSNICYMSM